MVNKKQNTAEDPEVVIESAINRTEEFIRQNGKTILTVLGAMIAIVGSYFAYQNLHKYPRQEKAATAMFNAQNAFAQEDYALALNGDGNSEGFAQVAEKFGNTPSGNLARHYAGQCQLRLGNYREAIEYFEKYKPVKGIPAGLTNAINAGLTGDAYVQLGDLEKGISMYEKAVKADDNMLTTPYYCRKAGQIYSQLGNYAKALEMFQIVSTKYPTSAEARDIDKYIGQAEQHL